MKNFSRLAIGAVFAMATVPAFAQDANEEAPNDGDIIVTANRTESLASKTPIALTAISGEGLAKAGVTSTAALADHVPNLVMASSNGGLQITIRGITNEEATERGDPSAAFLIDNVYIGRPQAVEVAMFDVARVEVLRGPQGTLFGRNTTAGLVHLITNKPNFEFGGSADFTMGNYGTVQATGVVNMPVSDSFALRASVNYDRRNTYIKQGPLFTGDYKPFKDNISARLQGLLRWDSGEFVLRGDYADIGGRPFDILPLSNFYAVTAPVTANVDPAYIGGKTSDLLKVNAPITWDGFRHNKSWGISGDLTQELGPVQATYVGSYREFDRFEADPKVGVLGTNAYRLNWNGNFKQQSHELRFATGDGPLKLQAGGYYFKEDIRQSLFLLLAANSSFLGNTVNANTNKLSNENYGFFAQGTYSLTDSLRLTAGARYSHDEKSRPDGNTNTCDRFDCSGTVTRTSTNIAEARFSKTTWRVGLDYDLNSSALLYATVSTGYKAGGFNDGCELGTAPGCTVPRIGLYYEPETLTAYEAGVKARLLDNALRFNLSAFRYDYTNIQLFQLIADCGGGASCSATTNGGKARVSGVELDGTLAAGDNGTFEFGFTYLDAHFVKFNPIPTVDFAGRPLSKSPKYTLSLGYTHSFPLDNGGNIEASARTRISDDYQFLSISTRNYFRQPGFSKTDLTLGYYAPDKKWYVQGFVRNLENKLPITTVIIGTRSAVQTQAPRTFGVSGGFKF